MRCPNCHDTHVKTVPVSATDSRWSYRRDCLNCGCQWFDTAAPVQSDSEFIRDHFVFVKVNL